MAGNLNIGDWLLDRCIDYPKIPASSKIDLTDSTDLSTNSIDQSIDLF